MEGSLEAKYFHNPWTVISAVAAAVLLILAIIQTVCSIIHVVWLSYFSCIQWSLPLKLLYMSFYNLSIFPPSLASSATCPTGTVGVTAIATAFQAKSIKKMGDQMQSICDNKITFNRTIHWSSC
jgi:cellulose synthase/poly-beta-1,6-N-acetylglucosamine synthase-like glycosyltransferase